MRRIASRNAAAFAVLAAVSLVATPLVMGTSAARATAEGAATTAVASVDPAPATAPSVRGEACTRKVRVVYGNGYGAPASACQTR